MTHEDQMTASIAMGLIGAVDRFKADVTRSKKNVESHIAAVYLTAIKGTLGSLSEPGVTPELIAAAVDRLAEKLKMKKVEK